MYAFLEIFDSYPAICRTISWGSLVLCLVSIWPARRAEVRRSGLDRLGHPLVFAGLVLLTLGAFRWPSWFVARELNPDESQIIAGAITLREYPVYWRDVDGTTHGPLNEYLLTLASFAGLPLSYPGARLFAAILLGGSLLCLWRALRHLLPEPLARLGILPALLFWSLCRGDDYLYFSSELVAVFLIAAALWGASITLASSKPNRLAAAMTGLVLAGVPLAKMQAAPLAAGMGVGVLAIVAWTRRPGWPRIFFAVAGGALGVVLALGVFLQAHGLTAQFWHSAVESNLFYAVDRKHPLSEMPYYFFRLFWPAESFTWFYYGCLAFILVSARRALGSGSPRLQVALLAGWLMVALAHFGILAPGRDFTHYLQLLVIPVTFLTALHLPPDGRTEARPAWRQLVPVLLFIVLAILPQAVKRRPVVPESAGRFDGFAASPVSSAGAFIRERRQPGERLAVWGWNSQVYVDSQLPQATRESHSAFELIPGPLREFYRSRYLRDMRDRRPEWFVDAVGPRQFGFKNRSVDGHETFPGLNRLIRDDYDLLADVDSVRIYRRKTLARH